MSMLINIKQTESLRFILPILNEYGIVDDDVTIEEFVGCYLGDSTNIDYSINKLLLEYRPSSTAAMDTLDSMLTSLPIYKSTYKREDTIVYVLDIEEEKYADVMDLFQQGLYSRFPEEYKKQIINFWGLSSLEGNDPISGILYLTETGREMIYNNLSETIKNLTAENEFWPKPDMSKEIL